MPIPRSPIAFDIIERDPKRHKNVGHYIIYFDGHIEGLKNASITRNYAWPVWLKMQALEGELERENEYIKDLEKRLSMRR